MDRLLRNLLVDLTGNTHRAEFSIDKLYSPDSATGRLGLLEFRAFEMPPHWQMSCVQMLLLRALIARFWKQPYHGRLISWGTSLHDRFMLPHFVAEDMRDVVLDLQARRLSACDFEWFAPFFEFRFPRYGTVVYQGISLELRQALEPWHVLGEEVTAGRHLALRGFVRRAHAGQGQAHDRQPLRRDLQRPAASARPDRHARRVRGRRALPGVAAALRAASHHRVHAPLVFDLVDLWSGRSLGGCTYHVVHPGGRSYERFPVNANEAEARRMARFTPHGHTPGAMAVRGRTPQPRASHSPSICAARPTTRVRACCWRARFTRGNSSSSESARAAPPVSVLAEGRGWTRRRRW